MYTTNASTEANLHESAGSMTLREEMTAAIRSGNSQAIHNAVSRWFYKPTGNAGLVNDTAITTGNIETESTALNVSRMGYTGAESVIDTTMQNRRGLCR